MGKWWSLLFAVVMLACLGLFVAAPSLGWWLPEGVSTHAGEGRTPDPMGSRGNLATPEETPPCDALPRQSSPWA